MSSKLTWDYNKLRDQYLGAVQRLGSKMGVISELAREYNISYSAVHSALRRMPDWAQIQAPRAAPPVETTPTILPPDNPQYRKLAALLHPQPFAVTYPRIAKPVEDDSIITGVLAGDSHGQFIDHRAEEVMLAVAADLSPDVFVHMGDAVDCYTLSAFDKDPQRKEGFQEEIDAAREHLARIRKVLPDSAIYLLEGNHEDRLRRTIFRSDRGMREIAKLRSFQDAITWPNLLQLEDLGIMWVPSLEQTRTHIFPKFILKHGSVVRKWSGWSAKGEWEKYGKSGASGHTHRLSAFLHRDHNGNHIWAETGCLCDLNPDYTLDPDWHQGFAVVTFEQSTGAFQVEPVYIHHGTAVWRGKRYRACG